MEKNKFSAWNSIVHPIMRQFRRNRARRILELRPDFNSCKVCDLGGSRHFWEKMKGILEPSSLVILNISDSKAEKSQEIGILEHYKIELYDGVSIPYADAHFDVVICNSVIEHVPPSQRRELMRELQRVGKCFFVQTPAKIFPIEPHFMMPIIHWLPRKLGRRLTPFGLYRFFTRANREALDAYFDEVQLLTLNEFRSYLPNAELYTERMAGIPKSYTLYRL